MAEQWSYRMFGHDFGPVGFDELRQLAELGSISSTDEVRRSDSSDWVAASSVKELGLGGEGSVSSSHRAPEPTAVSSAPAGADDWYCKLHGQELGPLTFDELLEFAERGQFDANDEVKLGDTGKWRRVGSIGRLVAVLPFHEPQVAEAKPPEKPPSRPVSAPPAAVAPPAPVAAPAPVMPNPNFVAAQHAVAMAETSLAAADKTAKMLVSWALAPNVDPAWWAWLGGAEYGPVGFVQIYEWTMTDRMKISDFIKNGFHGQYGPAANVPGLSSAVSIMSQAKETLKAAQEAMAAIAATLPPAPVASIPAPAAPTPVAAPPVVAIPKPIEAPKPVAPAPAAKSNPDIASPKPEPIATPAARTEEQARPTVSAVASTAPSPAPASYQSSSSFAAPTPRPTMTPARPPVRSSSSSSGGGFSTEAITDFLKNPKVLGGIAAVLLVVGFFYLPKGHGKDIQRYRDLKQLLDDVRSARAGSKEFEPLKTRATTLSTDITAALKTEAGNDYPAKQALFWAARDEVPRMMKGDLTKESASEKNLELRLNDAAKMMGIK